MTRKATKKAVKKTAKVAKPKEEKRPRGADEGELPRPHGMTADE